MIYIYISIYIYIRAGTVHKVPALVHITGSCFVLTFFAAVRYDFGKAMGIT